MGRLGVDGWGHLEPGRGPWQCSAGTSLSAPCGRRLRVLLEAQPRPLLLHGA